MKWRLIPLLFLLVACVDSVDFRTPEVEDQFVVEGTITDQPGPHTLYFSKIFSNRLPSHLRVPVTGAQIDLYEDDVKIDTFTEQEDGLYKTSASVTGHVGHVYHVVIRNPGGVLYTSEPERMIPSGDFNEIKYEIQDAETDRFNIYVDSQPGEADDYTRWRVTGIYKVIAFPELVIATSPDFTEVPAPLPCSGMLWDPKTRSLLRFGPCTCCECWVTRIEESYYVSDPHLRTSDGYRHVKVGDVPITRRTFYDKYRVEVEQLSMTANAHEFFRQLKSQREGVGSLFQPSFGEIKGNITSSNPDETVLGYFWATSVVRKDFWLNKSDVPYTLPLIDTVRDNCNTIGGLKSSFTKPDYW